MNLELNNFERQYLFDMLKAKQLEYKNMGVKTGTINYIVDKLTAKTNNDIDIDEDGFGTDMIFAKPTGRYINLDDKVDKNGKLIAELQNSIAQKRWAEIMENLMPKFDVPFIKR